VTCKYLLQIVLQALGQCLRPRRSPCRETRWSLDGRTPSVE
jgi:hypothetical protein